MDGPKDFPNFTPGDRQSLEELRRIAELVERINSPARFNVDLPGGGEAGIDSGGPYSAPAPRDELFPVRLDLAEYLMDLADLDAAGTGYAASDTITLAGDRVDGILKVLTVSGSAVDTFQILQLAVFDSPPTNPVPQSATTGSGTGAAFNLTLVGGSTPTLLYSWTEQTFDENGRLVNLPGGRSGLTPDNPAAEINGRLVDVPSFAWLRFRIAGPPASVLFHEIEAGSDSEHCRWEYYCKSSETFTTDVTDWVPAKRTPNYRIFPSGTSLSILSIDPGTKPDGSPPDGLEITLENAWLPSDPNAKYFVIPHLGGMGTDSMKVMTPNEQGFVVTPGFAAKLQYDYASLHWRLVPAWSLAVVDEADPLDPIQGVEMVITVNAKVEAGGVGVAKVTPREKFFRNGSLVGIEPGLNFIPGANLNITMSDSTASGGRVNATFEVDGNPTFTAINVNYLSSTSITVNNLTINGPIIYTGPTNYFIFISGINCDTATGMSTITTGTFTFASGAGSVAY